MVKEIISHNRFLDKIGEGGMGIVYKALDKKLDRTVTIKFHPSKYSDNDINKQNFLRDHPIIPCMYEGCPRLSIIHRDIKIRSVYKQGTSG